MRNNIWIAWERQRRTLEMSDALKTRLYIISSKSSAFFRYLVSSTKTLFILCKEKPRVLIVQNPSMILAVLSCLLRPLFKYRLIVDRHSNFLLGKTQYTFIDKVFLLLSDFSIKKADLTIVTNENLRKLVETKGGRGLVLPDRLPTPRVAFKHNLKRSNIVTFICTYASDEPYKEVIMAASFLDKDIKIYITGNSRKADPEVFEGLSENVVVTGFISDEEYDELLQKSDIIMDFTKLENCMVCGAYEAVAMGKPLITSNTHVLRDYFTHGVLHIDHSPESICKAINQVYDNYNEYLDGIQHLKDNIEKNWSAMFNELKDYIDVYR
ncbi:MAG: glycosyltransferase [Desulfomonilia bacterium]